ncbi:MAG: hypothetical protein HY390_00560 [Deltaproteobacteria bacterium]|nr:hypothetical protein [Deltaproteobacteria bacterium]
MNKFVFSLMLGLLMVGSSAFADVDLSGDLSGSWRLTASNRDGKSLQYDIVVLKTDLKVDGKEPYYSVSGDVGGMKTVGLSINERSGKKYIRWIRLASPNSDAEGTRLDSEFNMVLKTEADILVLGGDHEEHERVRMTKYPYLSK